MSAIHLTSRAPRANAHLQALLKMVIIEPPWDPYDVAGWRECIARLRTYREEMNPDEYDLMLTSFAVGLAGALTGPPPPSPGPRMSIRERVKQARRSGLLPPRND